MYRQRGMGLYGWIFVIVAVGTIAVLVIRLTPIYLNDRTLATQVEHLIESEPVSKMTRRQIREALEKRLRINSLNLDLRKVMTITKEGRLTTIVIDYEEREHLVGNIDVVLSFHHEHVAGE